MGGVLVSVSGNLIGKAMRRYWVELSHIQENEVHFSGEIFHHIFDVCRQEKGSKFEVLTENAEAHFVEVLSVAKKNAVAKIIETRKLSGIKEPRIHLLMSVPRFPVLESILEKAVEMGVYDIHLFSSDYSFVKSKTMISDSKIDRWSKIIISATQQTGRGDLMKLYPLKTMGEVLSLINRDQGDLGLFAYEGEGVLNLKDFLTRHKTKKQDSKDIWIIVGAEGGFSHLEVSKLGELGFDPVTLGTQVLRVETACMTLVSVLKYEFNL